MKRVFDLILFFCLVPVLLVPILVIAVLVRLTFRGPALYWSDRVGVGNRIFKMPKFRTMRIDTPPVATHLLANPDEYLTPIGPFLRKSSLDELPQLWSVLKGDMSFVGPRPALLRPDCLADGTRGSSIDSGDHGMGADQWPGRYSDSEKGGI